VVLYTALMNKTRFQVHLDPKQLAALQAIQETTGAPISESIRRAIDAWLLKRAASKKRTRP
jgi:Ribbon-helix-helix protein, copG family